MTMRSFLLLLLLLMLLLPTRAVTDESTIAETLIPFDSLTITNRLLVGGVTDHYTLRREYRPQQIKARAEHFAYMLDHIDACSALAYKLGLIKYRASRDAQDRIYADDREGSAGYLLQVYAHEGKRVYYVAGSHAGPLSVTGRGVAVMDQRTVSTNIVEYHATVFVKVDNRMVAAISQLFAMFVRGAVDKNFHQVMRHPVRISEMALTDPKKLLATIHAMPEADRKLLQPFADLVSTSSGLTNNPAGQARAPAAEP